MILRKYEPGDWRALRLAPETAALLAAQEAAGVDVGKLLWESYAWTAADEETGEILAVGGVFQETAWRGQAYLLASKGFAEAAAEPSALRRLKRFALEKLEKLPLARIEATTADAAACHRRFAEWLGFRFEGLMEGYGQDGAAFRRYAIVRSAR